MNSATSIVLILSLCACSLFAETPTRETPTRLAPRPIPGMSAPTPVVTKPRTPVAPKTIPVNEVKDSGAARILFIYRRGTFTLPKSEKARITNSTPRTSDSNITPSKESDIKEGTVRIVPQSSLRNQR